MFVDFHFLGGAVAPWPRGPAVRCGLRLCGRTRSGVAGPSVMPALAEALAEALAHGCALAASQ